MRFKGSDIRLVHEYGSGWRFSVAVTGDQVQIARAAVDELKSADISVELKKWYNRRSLDANNYAWELIGKIAEATKQSKTDVYRAVIREIGGNSTTVCVQENAVESLRAVWGLKGIGWITDTMPSKIDGCTNVILYYGSSAYDTHQMSLLIDHLIQDAKALGIETLPPADLERMMAQWRSIG